MKNFVLKSLVATVVFFILGWLVYGMLLAPFMDAQTNPLSEPIMRPDTGMVWWAMIVGNLCFGMLLAFVIVRAKITSFRCHVVASAIVGMLLALSNNLMTYSMLEMTTLAGVLVDVLTMLVLSAIVGAAMFLVGKDPYTEVH